MNEEKFKNKHGGYNPYELAIHKRGFLCGFLGALIGLVVFSLCAIMLLGYLAI